MTPTAAPPRTAGTVRGSPFEASVWLDNRWYAWLVFGRDDTPAAYQWVVRRLQRVAGVTVKPGTAREDGTEFSGVRAGLARLLLARKIGVGVSLGTERAGLPVLLKFAAGYGARGRGWRWRVYRIRVRLGVGVDRRAGRSLVRILGMAR